MNLRRTVGLLSLILGLALLSGAASAGEEMVDNPEYKSWSAYKAGTMTKLASITEMAGNKTEMTTGST